MSELPVVSLIRNCVVRITSNTRKCGTGFFVAPRTILTCAHVIGAQTSDIEITWSGKQLVATLVPATGDADLALLQINSEEQHPSVLLHADVRLGDELYSYGYTDQQPAGDSVTAEFEGTSGTAGLLKFKQGQVRPGLSGSPLHNLRTGCVCGVVSISRDRETDLGGRAVAVSAVLERYPQLVMEQTIVHGSDPVWLRSMDPLQQKAIVALPRDAKQKIAPIGFPSNSRKRPALGVFWQLHKYAPSCEPYGRWKLAAPTGSFVRLLTHEPPQNGWPHGLLYAGMDNDQGIYQSTDGGFSWDEANIGLGCRSINDISVSPFDGSVLAATDRGVWISNDHGTTWAPFQTPEETLTVLRSPDDPAFLAFGKRKQGGGIGISTTTVAVAAAESTSEMKPARGLSGGNLQISRTRGLEWVSFPIETINAATFSPHDSRVAYVASADSGLFVTRNGFETLAALENTKDLRPLRVAIPADYDAILMGGLKGLFVSLDQGTSWTRAEEIGDIQVADILCVDGKQQRVLAATRRGIFESLDGAKTWNECNEGLDYRWTMSLLQIDSDVFVGTSGGGVFRRSLSRRNWIPHNLGFPTTPCAPLVASSNHLFGAGLGVFHSSDRGSSWKRRPAPDGVRSMAVASERNEDEPPRVHAAGMSISSTGGMSWSSNDRVRGRILAGVNDSVWISADAGETWSLVHAFPGGRGIREIILSPRNRDLIYVLVDHAGLFRSRDFGGEWQRIDNESFGAIAALAMRNDELLATTLNGDLLRSDDEGTSWLSSGKTFAADPIITVACSANSSKVFVISRAGAFSASVDGGATFEHLSNVAMASRKPWATLFPSRSNPQQLWLGTSLGAWESRDGGRSWEGIDGGLIGERYHVNAFTALGNTLYASMAQGVFALPDALL